MEQQWTMKPSKFVEHTKGYLLKLDFGEANALDGDVETLRGIQGFIRLVGFNNCLKPQVKRKGGRSSSIEEDSLSAMMFVLVANRLNKNDRNQFRG